jgi:hypothetical protein
MGILAQLFGWVPAADRDGIRLEERDCWEVSSTRDVERFLRALPLLAPPRAMAYFEGTAERHVAEYLQQVSVTPTVQVAMGTIWPRPDCYHVPLTLQSMEALAAFLEAKPAGFFCSHCHVYDAGLVLLQWHDAFGGDPMLVSRRIGAETVGEFAAALGSSYGATGTGGSQ